uniref:Uncharacterized protein n=1 Tax=Oryza brachyantha TaxID=4533 RepID=J3LHJ5_ORYBR
GVVARLGGVRQQRPRRRAPRRRWPWSPRQVVERLLRISFDQTKMMAPPNCFSGSVS